VKAKSVICRGRARAIEDAIDAWNLDHDNALSARDMEDVVGECLSTRDFLSQWHQTAWEHLFAGRLANIQQAGELLRSATGKLVHVFAAVQTCVKWMERKGYPVDKAVEFEAAARAVEGLLADLNRRWPFIDPQQVEEARAAFARGEGIPAEEILRELQSSHL
jgi:hypothetical protein